MLRFEYSYVGLPALDGPTYASGPNLLGLALSALMKLPVADRARIKAEGLDRIARSQENDVRKELLAEFFNHYLKLSPAEEVELARLEAERFQEAKTMVNSFEEQGRVKGIRGLVRKLLEKKFGPLGVEVLRRLELLPIDKVEEIALALADAKSLDELEPISRG